MRRRKGQEDELSASWGRRWHRTWREREKSETLEGITTVYGYRYDLAGRLVEVLEDGSVVASYSYDANGNRLGKITSSGSELGTYDAQDRMRSYSGRSFEYNRNGVLTTESSVLGERQYDYDAQGNLLGVELEDGRSVRYVVDARGRRIVRKVDGVATHRFLWQSDLRIAAEVDSTGQVLTRYVYGTQINVPDLMVREGVTYRILHDHLGSPRLVVDTATGEIVRRLDFDEWGNVTLDTNPNFHPFGFAGGLYDSATGLTRFGARDYDATVGRWTAKDLLGFGALSSNLFVYLGGEPVNRRDPAGSAEECGIGPPNQFWHSPDPLPVGCPGIGGALQMARDDQTRTQRILEETDEGSRQIHPAAQDEFFNDVRRFCETANQMPEEEQEEDKDKSLWEQLIEEAKEWFDEVVAKAYAAWEWATERLVGANPPSNSCNK